MNTSFFRVCHSKEKTSGYFTGPYIGHYHEGCSLSDMKWAHNQDRTDPGVRDDPGGFFISSHHICGFESLDKLANWFDSWGQALAKCGFVVREYRIPQELVHHGMYQSIAPIGYVAGRRAVKRYDPIEVIA